MSLMVLKRSFCGFYSFKGRPPHKSVGWSHGEREILKLKNILLWGSQIIIPDAKADLPHKSVSQRLFCSFDSPKKLWFLWVLWLSKEIMGLIWLLWVLWLFSVIAFIHSKADLPHKSVSQKLLWFFWLSKSMMAPYGSPKQFFVALMALQRSFCGTHSFKGRPPS
jgi:hypothetical protein